MHRLRNRHAVGISLQRLLLVNSQLFMSGLLLMVYRTVFFVYVQAVGHGINISILPELRLPARFPTNLSLLAEWLPHATKNDEILS